MPKIDNLFGMIKGPRRRRAAVLMAGIRGSRRVAVPHGARKTRETDRAGIAAVTDTLKFAVPVGGREPDFEADIGVGRRLDRSGNTAEPGNIGDSLGAGRREITGGPGLRDVDDSVRQR